MRSGRMKKSIDEITCTKAICEKKDRTEKAREENVCVEKACTKNDFAEKVCAKGCSAKTGVFKRIFAKGLVKRTAAAVMALALCLSLCCCKGQDKKTENTIFAMDTYMTFTVYGKNSADVSEKCRQEIQRLDSFLSPDGENSELNKINQSEQIELSDEMAYIIKSSIELSKATDGAFDITVGALTELWGFSGDKEYYLPSGDEINTALKTVGYEKLSIEGNVLKKPLDTKIDVGAIAKGYATDRLFEILEKEQPVGAVISLGGNVLTFGKNPSGKDWSVAVTDPDDRNGYVKMLYSVGKQAFVTSGDYQRYFEQNGQKYHHILDPKTGYPADTGLRSVTIVCQSGFCADALSTAVFAAGADRAAEFSKKTVSFDAVYVTDKNEVIEQSCNAGN